MYSPQKNNSGVCLAGARSQEQLSCCEARKTSFKIPTQMGRVTRSRRHYNKHEMWEVTVKTKQGCIEPAKASRPYELIWSQLTGVTKIPGEETRTFSQRPKANPYSRPQTCPGQRSPSGFSSEEPAQKKKHTHTQTHTHTHTHTLT